MGHRLCTEQGHEGHICEVPQEDVCPSMYINYYALSSCIYMYCRIMIHFVQHSVLDYLFAIPAPRRSDS
jgi:hypothetical protein